jgi:hypothetical protein
MKQVAFEGCAFHDFNENMIFLATGQDASPMNIGWFIK